MFECPSAYTHPPSVCVVLVYFQLLECHPILTEMLAVTPPPVCFFLFHTMACFYMIHRYAFSDWRSIKPVEINQYDITMSNHYDSIMGNDIARDGHFEITMSNDVQRDIHYDVIMNNDVVMCTYHGITMHNDIGMNIFYYVFSALYLLIVLFSYGMGSMEFKTLPMCSTQTDQKLTCCCYTIAAHLHVEVPFQMGLQWDSISIWVSRLEQF